MRLKCKKLSDTAVIPTKAFDTDLGFDLYADSNYILQAGAIIPSVISTGICCEFPLYTSDEFSQLKMGGLIRDRSGRATKDGLVVVAGVIDFEYRGEIKVAMYLMGPIGHSVSIATGDKIAQMILIPTYACKAEEVEEFTTATLRGERGFGSSGNGQ